MKEMLLTDTLKIGSLCQLDLYILKFSINKTRIKPYLQPFEKLLAIKELQSLIGNDANIIEEHGYYLVDSAVEEELLLNKLTFWQRLGRKSLVPTLQKTLELTQSGYKKTKEVNELHNARRLRYGPHDVHEYRGKVFFLISKKSNKYFGCK
jgi:site-specific DNA-methyltransferase (cytosine-N4-specific)